MILGTILYLPQYYAYSQVELLLVAPLQSELPNQVAYSHTSRFLMKGYKFQRFVLDLQLLPGISLSGLALELQVSLSSLISIVAKSSSIKGY